jgi:hypothetical protein
MCFHFLSHSKPNHLMMTIRLDRSVSKCVCEQVVSVILYDVFCNAPERSSSPSRRGLRIFFTTATRMVPIQWVPGTLSLGVKRPGRKADHSPPCSVEVKNAWSYTSTPQYVFMAWCLVKHRGNFTLPERPAYSRYTLQRYSLSFSERWIG